MKRVNLLPAHHATRNGAGGWTGFRHIIVACLVPCVLLGSWAALAISQAREMDARIADASREIDAMRRTVESRQAERADNTPQAMAALSATLREPVPTTALLALVSQIVPEQAIVRSMVIDVPDVVTTIQGREANRKAGAASPASPLSIVLEGIAMDDVVVARMVASFAAYGLPNAKVEENRETTFREQRVHQFRLRLSLESTIAALAGAMTEARP